MIFLIKTVQNMPIILIMINFMIGVENKRIMEILFCVVNMKCP